MRRFARAIGWRRVAEAQNRLHADFDRLGELKGYPSDRPWTFPLDDRRCAMQTVRSASIQGTRDFLRSPEWMIALTCREIVRAQDGNAWQLLGCHQVEYRLMLDNRANAYLPLGKLTPAEFLWQRLEHYCGITKDDPYQFTTELLNWSLAVNGVQFPY